MKIPRWLATEDPHPEYSRLDRMDGLGSLDQPETDADDKEQDR